MNYELLSTALAKEPGKDQVTVFVEPRNTGYGRLLRTWRGRYMSMLRFAGGRVRAHGTTGMTFGPLAPLLRRPNRVRQIGAVK